MVSHSERKDDPPEKRFIYTPIHEKNWESKQRRGQKGVLTLSFERDIRACCFLLERRRRGRERRLRRCRCYQGACPVAAYSSCVCNMYIHVVNTPPHTHTHIHMPSVRVYDTKRETKPRLCFSRPFSLLPAGTATAQTKAHLQHLPTCMLQMTPACVIGCQLSICLHHPDLNSSRSLSLLHPYTALTLATW